MNLAGRTLGEFEIEALVGKGSMACVYRARQIPLRRHVALKVLEEAIFTPSEKVKRFFREAEALARLEHPHIVPIYDAGEQAPYYYFAMRLVRGGTLAEALRAGVSIGLGFEWVRQVCQALAFAHGAGIIHRDLKPSNVLLHDEVALLGDFGLAHLRDLSTVTQIGTIMGTPLFMSPEQTLGQRAGPATDCFALGVILYQILTGRHPFVGVHDEPSEASLHHAQIFKRIQKGEFQPPSAVNPEVPAAVEKVVLRALARLPEERYPDGAAMLRGLDEARGSLGGSVARIVSVSLGGGEAPDVPPTQVVRPHPLPSMEESEGGTEVVPPASGPGSEPPAAGVAGGKMLALFGRYQLQREIGHGGQGVVYEARDPVLDREVALKVLQEGWNADEELAKLFLHEARVAARLSHPHIIQVYDYGIQKRVPFLTMQLVGGPSLDKLIEKGEPLPLAFTLKVLAQAAGALAYAHDAGVVHLDVKPGNILIHSLTRKLPPGAPLAPGDLEAPHVFLTDFTMAMLWHTAATRAGGSGAGRGEEAPAPKGVPAITSGTIPYASPEQLRHELALLGPASDIFSLGVVFHEMLTGRRLFAADNPAAAKMLVLHADVPVPSSRVPGLPAECDELCARMLCRRKEDRLASAAEVAAFAQRLLGLLQKTGA